MTFTFVFSTVAGGLVFSAIAFSFVFSEGGGLWSAFARYILFPRRIKIVQNGKGTQRILTLYSFVFLVIFSWCVEVNLRILRWSFGPIRDIAFRF
jgi:hypothetical protein